jgi:hypothetical protein
MFLHFLITFTDNGEKLLGIATDVFLDMLETFVCSTKTVGTS